MTQKTQNHPLHIANSFCPHLVSGRDISVIWRVSKPNIARQKHHPFCSNPLPPRQDRMNLTLWQKIVWLKPGRSEPTSLLIGLHLEFLLLPIFPMIGPDEGGYSPCISEGVIQTRQFKYLSWTLRVRVDFHIRATFRQISREGQFDLCQISGGIPHLLEIRFFH